MHQPLGRPIISWRKSLHLDFNLSRSRRAAIPGSLGSPTARRIRKMGLLILISRRRKDL